jgi:hypothetical protein
MSLKKYKAIASFGVEGGASIMPKQELELNPEDATTKSWLKYKLIEETTSIDVRHHKNVKVK